MYTKGGVLAGIAKEIDVDFEFSIWVHLALLKLKKELINPTYLEAVLNSSFGKSQAKKYKRGIANKDIVLGRIKKIAIPIPPLKKQEEFAIAVKKIRKLINSSNMSLEMTSELRNSLQVKIFKGKIIV